MEPLTVSVRQAIEVTGLSRDLLYFHINSGALKSITLGKRRLINFASLKSLVGAAGEKEAAP